MVSLLASFTLTCFVRASILMTPSEKQFLNFSARCSGTGFSGLSIIFGRRRYEAVATCEFHETIGIKDPNRHGNRTSKQTHLQVKTWRAPSPHPLQRAAPCRSPGQAAASQARYCCSLALAGCVPSRLLVHPAETTRFATIVFRG